MASDTTSRSVEYLQELFYVLRNPENGHFSQRYRTLIKGIQNLNNVNAITYTTSAFDPEYCAVTTETIDEYPDSISDFNTASYKSHRVASWVRQRWTDAEVLFVIMLSHPKVFTKLAIEPSFPLGMIQEESYERQIRQSVFIEN